MYKLEEKEFLEFPLKLFNLKNDCNLFQTVDMNCYVVTNNGVIEGIIFEERGEFKTWFESIEARVFFFENFEFIDT